MLHNWPDEAAAIILKRLIPCLERGATVFLIMDQAVPEPGTNANEASARMLDLITMALFNGKSRSMADWHSLVTLVDERLKIAKITYPPGSILALIELRLASF